VNLNSKAVLEGLYHKGAGRGGGPCELAVVWALSAHLEMEPLVQKMLFVERVIGEFPFRVVLLDEVLDNRPGFPESQISVGINNGWMRQRQI
jgi:hypothetical protein